MRHGLAGHPTATFRPKKLKTKAKTVDRQGVETSQTDHVLNIMAPLGTLATQQTLLPGLENWRSLHLLEPGQCLSLPLKLSSSCAVTLQAPSVLRRLRPADLCAFHGNNEAEVLFLAAVRDLTVLSEDHEVKKNRASFD